MDISDLLATMATERASDLYLSHGAPPAIVVAGVQCFIGDKALTPIDTHAIAYSVMNDRQQKDFEATLEMNLGIAPAGIGRFRVNIYRQRNEIAIAIRYISTEIPSIDSLRLPPTLRDLVMLPRGYSGRRRHGFGQVDDPCFDARLSQSKSRWSYPHCRGSCRVPA